MPRPPAALVWVADEEDDGDVELEEEAGYRAGKLTPLATLHEVPEFARSCGHAFIAEDLEPVPAKREDGEATMTVETATRAEVRRRFLSGEQKSVTMTAAFYHFEAARPAGAKPKKRFSFSTRRPSTKSEPTASTRPKQKKNYRELGWFERLFV